MTRAKLARLLPLVALALFSTPAARAQGVRVFVMGGGSFLEDERFFTRLGDRFRSNYASGGKITFGGEFSLAPVFGFEGIKRSDGVELHPGAEGVVPGLVDLDEGGADHIVG